MNTKQIDITKICTSNKNKIERYEHETKKQQMARGREKSPDENMLLGKGNKQNKSAGKWESWEIGRRMLYAEAPKKQKTKAR